MKYSAGDAAMAAGDVARAAIDEESKAQLEILKEFGNPFEGEEEK